MSFSPDGKILAGSTAQRLRFWDPGTGQELHTQPGDLGPTLITALSPDGRYVAAVNWIDRAVSLWDTASGRLVRQLPLRGEQRYAPNLAFSSDGRTLVASQYEGFLQFWDVATGAERRTAQLDDPTWPNKNLHYFYQSHVSPDGGHVSTLLQRFDGPQGEYTQLALWDTATGKPLARHALPAATRVCAWRPDGKAVAVALKDGLALVDVVTGEHRFHAPGVSGGPPAASPDYRLLAARRTSVPGKGPAVTVGVWETATGKEVTALAAGRADRLALTPDNRHLVTTDEAFLRVFDLATGRERRRWNLPVAMTDSQGNGFVTALLVLPDGRRAFTALADGTGLVWDLSPALTPARLLSESPGEQSLAAWWADLAGEDAGRAYAAVWRLTEAGEAAVPFLARHLRPTSAADPKKVRQLIEDLDSDAFDVRERASRQLAELGSAAEPALRQALGKDPSAEVKRRLEALLSRPTGFDNSPDARRCLRAVQVLERIGSKEARRVLDGLASGGR
jgi:WD40 repeat protein